MRIGSATSYRGRNARPNFVTLALSIAAALAASGLGVWLSPAHSSATAAWYAGLAKPSWVPLEDWIGPVWMALGVLIGSAAWLVSRERYHARHAAALAAYGVQLVLTAAWAPLFFGLHNVGAGLFAVVAVWLATCWTLREFSRVRILAAAMLVPYLVWITVAMALNFSIWRLNL